jgi:hypothetical protein
VDTRANSDAEALDSFSNCPTAADSSRWTIKSGKETISRRVDFATAIPRKLVTNKQVMLSKKVFPCVITEFDYLVGGANDISEQYACEHSV